MSDYYETKGNAVKYEGDYRCQVSEGLDDPCNRVASQVRREPYTPAGFRVLTCDEHADKTYSFDAEATAQLLRDVERERILCEGCDGELTTADYEGGQCTQCQEELR